MTFTVDTQLQGACRGDYDKLATWAISNGAKRPDDLRSYLDHLYRLAPVYNLNAAILAAQSAHETGGWTSAWWENRLNPAGIGITGDPDQDNASRDFRSGEAAARAHVLHMGLYTCGDEIRAGFRREDDPRWESALAAGMASIATTLADLTGRWATDPDYATKLVGWLDRLDAAGLLSGTAGTSGSSGPDPVSTGRDRPVVLAIGMGHRNKGRGGARDEIDWTPEAARALQRRARARGILAELIAEHDEDNQDDWSNTDRQSAAKIGVRNIERLHGNVDVVIFMHYNGGGAPGAHFIHPDGWASPFRKDDNPGDVRLCRRIKNHVKATSSVGLLAYQTWMDEPGVMSEKETGAVAHRSGFRLGEMLGVEDWRENTFRVIAEAGSIDVAREAAYIRDPRWVEFTYCEAILDAIEEELGHFGTGTGSSGHSPNPIEPEPIEPGFSQPIRIPELDAFKGRPDEHIPAAVHTESEGWFFFIGRDVRVTKSDGTPRHRLPDESNADRTGVNVPEGEAFYAWWGGISASGRPYAYTLWASRIWLEDTDFALGLEGAVATQ
jgi:hypothetical protein